MISLSLLNKLIQIIIFVTILFLNPAISEEAADIWKNKKNQNSQNNQTNEEEEIILESPILKKKISKIKIEIEENKVGKTSNNIIGIFDPEENNLSLDMWSATDGEDIKKVIKRISKLKLSRLSEELLFRILFTNAYAPKKNLTSEEFLKIKINWLITNKRFKDLEILLKNNPEAGQQPKAIEILVNEHLSSADIKSACEKIDFISKDLQNDYLEKFMIYCLINDNRKEEAQLLLDLLKERGLKDNFFENKINFLLGLNETTSQKILDNNLLNFYLSYVTIDDFQYQPTDKTNKYIWRYLSSANLIEVKDLENEEILMTYEKAAAEDSFEKDELFNIYLKMYFNFNQLANATEIYKNLPNYKARALLYQSILLNDQIEKKLYLSFLLQKLFIKDNLLEVYSDELVNILTSIDAQKIPEHYVELVKENLEKGSNNKKKIKFDNDIIHRSKVIRHFIENNSKVGRTEKDFKAVYKKIKKNKKYFISIKDIIVIESLIADGISVPADLDYKKLASQLTIPKNLENLMQKKQIGLLMLKIVEIIGEDNVKDLDPETVFFLNRILNQLNLKKIRNEILSEALPARA